MKKKETKNNLQIWQERLRKNEAAMRPEQERMKKRTALYEGTRSIDKTPDAKSKGPADKASGVRNIVAELIEAQVDPSVPMPKLTARKQEDEQLAKIAEDFLRNETDRLPFERLNDLDERISPVQGGDYFFVEWDSERHTHETQGELCVSLLHPRQVILQNGVNEINDMDFVIVNVSMTKNHVKAKYGIDVSMEGESDPESRGGEGVADDVVTVHFGYFRNEKGGIGRYTWVNDVELESLEDYQARRVKKCTKCGSDMTGLEACRYCGNTKAEESNSDKFQMYEDIQLSNGETISQYEETWEYPEGVSENGLMMDEMGNLFEAQPELVQKNREIPYYKPDVYPIIPRVNVSAWGRLLGDSDVDKISDQQNMIKKCDSRTQEKLDKGGSAIIAGEETEIEQTDRQSTHTVKERTGGIVALICVVLLRRVRLVPGGGLFARSFRAFCIAFREILRGVVVRDIHYSFLLVYSASVQRFALAHQRRTCTDGRRGRGRLSPPFALSGDFRSRLPCSVLRYHSLRDSLRATRATV